MTTIYYETVPVAHLTFDGEWTLDYDPGWEARRTAFPVSLTMPLRWGRRCCQAATLACQSASGNTFCRDRTAPQGFCAGHCRSAWSYRT
ncbi:HipA N-terminal domain-containing protein [Agrobacterium pusense]|uniref:HipA N-terminal domain-containing protein n=1 Tax=Agrobacterium pusense TaxID=648995 RepID=UPI0031F4738F